MVRGLVLVRSNAAIEGRNFETGSIVQAGVIISLNNGYPSVTGEDDQKVLNTQVQAWLDIDSASLIEIKIDNHAAPFFIDKSTTYTKFILLL